MSSCQSSLRRRPLSWSASLAPTTPWFLVWESGFFARRSRCSVMPSSNIPSFGESALGRGFDASTCRASRSICRFCCAGQSHYSCRLPAILFQADANRSPLWRKAHEIAVRHLEDPARCDARCGGRHRVPRNHCSARRMSKWRPCRFEGASRQISVIRINAP